MNQIIPFTYEGNNVRTLTTEDGELRFVLADLAAVLDITNVTQLRSRLSDDLCQTYPVPDRRGQVQQTWTVNEPGLYEVIIRSDKPEATQFRRWVTSEVHAIHPQARHVRHTNHHRRHDRQPRHHHPAGDHPQGRTSCTR